MTDVERLDTLLEESRLFPPPEAFRRAAHCSSEGIYESASTDREAFWAACASALDWYRRWDRVLEWKPPQAHAAAACDRSHRSTPAHGGYHRLPPRLERAFLLMGLISLFTGFQPNVLTT